MKPKTHLQKIIIGGALALLITISPLSKANAVTVTPSLVTALSPDVFITEVQTATSTSASEEFIELFNQTDHDIDFADKVHAGKDIWKIQYFSGTKLSTAGVTDWTLPTGAVDLSTMTDTIIPAHDYYLLAASKSDGSIYQPGGIEADGHYSAKLSDNTGLQLIDVVSQTAVTTAHDRVTWQKSANAPGVLSSPLAGSSLQRISNEDSDYVDGTGKLVGFQAKSPISPRDMWVEPIAPDDSDAGDNTGDLDDTPDSSVDGVTNSPVANEGLKPLAITELLPNPASPLTDANDEFIELYNPNAVSFDLSGYSLETGTTTLHDFTFATGSTLAAETYQAFYSSDTHLSLTNSGGQVRLLSPSKTKLSETAVYPTAADGQAWVLVAETWQWSASTTPNLPNVLLATLTSQTGQATKSTAAKVKGSNTVRAATKAKTIKAKTVKVKKAKVVKAKKKKAKKASTIKPASASLASVVQPTPIHAGVLAAVAVAAVLYALYEYRLDLANYLHRLRCNSPFRRGHRR